MRAFSTCGEPHEIKKNTHPKHITALSSLAGRYPTLHGLMQGVKERRCHVGFHDVLQTYTPPALQFHRDGAQFDFARSPARTMRPQVGPQYMQMSWRNQEKHPPEIYYRSFARAGRSG